MGSQFHKGDSMLPYKGWFGFWVLRVKETLLKQAIKFFKQEQKIQTR
jgi:hypothetical protein